MNSVELQQALVALQSELAKIGQADEATQKKLGVLIADIHRVLAESGHAQSENRPTETLMDRLQGALEAFEAHHPHLTATVQQLVDRLAELGI
jgi:hypothetical protein